MNRCLQEPKRDIGFLRILGPAAPWQYTGGEGRETPQLACSPDTSGNCAAWGLRTSPQSCPFAQFTASGHR